MSGKKRQTIITGNQSENCQQKFILDSMKSNKNEGVKYTKINFWNNVQRLKPSEWHTHTDTRTVIHTVLPITVIYYIMESKNILSSKLNFQGNKLLCHIFPGLTDKVHKNIVDQKHISAHNPKYY